MKRYIDCTLKKSLDDFYLKFEGDEFELYHLSLTTKQFKARGEDLSENEKNRKRFRTKDDIFNIGSRWGEKLTMYYKYLERINQGKSSIYTKDEIIKFEEVQHCTIIQYYEKIISSVFSSDLENVILTNEEIILRFSNITTFFKKYGYEKYGLCSFLYVNLEMLGDYAPPDVSNAKQGLIRWLVEDKEILCDNIIKEKFYELFVEGLKDFLNYDSFPTYDLIELKDFVKDVDLWGTGGTVGLRDKLIDKEIKKKHQMTKKSYGLLVNKGDLYQEVINTTEQRMKVNIKQELTKSRGVVNSDLNTYLLMAHLMYYVDKHMLGNEKSMQYLQGSQKVDKFYKKMYMDITDLNFPMDQSNFDANVTGRMITLALDEVIYYINQKRCSSVLATTMKILKRIILNGDIKADNKHYKHKSGIPSGWRMTAFLDSIINYAEIYSVMKLVQIYNVDYIDLKNIVVQGDDVSCVVGSKKQARMIVYTFDKLGLNMNEKKISINYNRSEFLRHIYFKKGKTLYQTGYAVRQIPTLLYAKPDDRNRITINSIISNWSKFLKRLGLYEDETSWSDCLSNIYNIIKSRNKRYKLGPIDIEHVRNYIFGPVECECYGENTIFSNKIKDNILKIIQQGNGVDILHEKKEIVSVKKYSDEIHSILNKENLILKRENDFPVFLNNENYFSMIIHKGQKERISYILGKKYRNETNYTRNITYRDISVLNLSQVRYKKINTIARIQIRDSDRCYSKPVSSVVYYKYLMNEYNPVVMNKLYYSGIELTPDFNLMRRATRNFLSSVLLMGENIYPTVHTLTGDNLNSLVLNNYITWLKYDSLLKVRPTMGLLRWIKSDVNTHQIRVLDINSSE